MKRFKIGLIDSGSMSNKGAFIKVCDDSYEAHALKKDIHGHGTALSSIITEEYATIICAQIYDDALRTTPQTVAFAIDYLLEQKVDLIHISLGLHANRQVLEDAINKALKSGVIIIASTATLSQYKIYPASYEGVIAVCADARCQKNEISFLNASHAQFGASALSENEKVRGSSVAAAYVTKALAKLYATESAPLDEQLLRLQSLCNFKTAQPRLSKGIA